MYNRASSFQLSECSRATNTYCLRSIFLVFHVIITQQLRSTSLNIFMQEIRTAYVSIPVYWSRLGWNRYGKIPNIHPILRAYLYFLSGAIIVKDLCTNQYKSTFPEK